jgi:UDP-N-acetylglucosamine 4,6-dehydratase
MNWKDKTVLVTGGTGSLGRALVGLLSKEQTPRQIVVFSRDELKQHEMRRRGFDAPALRYVLGDVRDPERLRRAVAGIDVVFHLAALKQVTAGEDNPIEFVKTNALGAQHVADTACEAGAGHVIALSTDKAVNPVSAYGATKLAAEKIFMEAGHETRTRFASVRCGNVLGSRGSVVEAFLEQRATGRLTLTDPHMTRFWTTREAAVGLLVRCAEHMQGGEIFVPKLPSMKLIDVAHAIAPECRVDVTGIRPGEKLHEVLLSEDESRYATETDDLYVIRPPHPGTLPEGFRFASDTNTHWLPPGDLKRHMNELVSERAPDPLGSMERPS